MDEDEEVINKIAAISELAQFGKYDILKLVFAINRFGLLNLVQEEVSALQRRGFVEVEYVQYFNSEIESDITLFTFNARWRALKRKGNFKDFVISEEEDRIEEIKKKKNERDFIEAQNSFLKLNETFIKDQTALIKDQKELIDNQKETNENTQRTNKALIIIFYGTFIIYVGQLVVSYIGLQYAKPTNEKQHIIQQDSTIKTLQNRNCQLEYEQHIHSKIIDSLKNLIPPNKPNQNKKIALKRAT